MKSMLTIEHLCLNLSGREIFHIENLTIPKGQVTALVGPNGSGKSSLLLTLALLQPATSGTITFDGSARQRREPARTAPAYGTGVPGCDAPRHHRPIGT